MRRFFMLSFVLLTVLTSCAVYQPRTNNTGGTIQAILPPERYTIAGSAEGTSCASFLFGIPVAGKNTYQDAIRNAIKAKQGDYFLQSSADEYDWFFLIPQLYHERCMTVEGLVIKFK